jgi:hypothetical protein
MGLIRLIRMFMKRDQADQSKLNSKPVKNPKLTAIFSFFKSLIITIIIVFSIKSYSTFMGVMNQGWVESNVPYDIKNEWILNCIVTGLRFRTSFGYGEGIIPNILQKIHYQIYLSAKSKIPDYDPYWVTFWEPATTIKKN